MSKYKASVVIPTYNEENYIKECVESLLKQSLKNFEIIIVDDGSTDDTIKIVMNMIKVNSRIILLEGAHKGPGFSRNFGAKKARSEILIFVDADMTFDKDYVKNLINPLLKDKKNKIVGTTHNYEIATNLENVWSRCWGKVRVSNLKEGYSDNVVVFRSIRKSFFDKFNGYDPSLGYADDQTFWVKYKVRPYIAADTRCFHRNPESIKEVYKQSRWIGASLIDNRMISTPIIKYLVPLGLYIISPIAIIYLSINKTRVLRNWRLFFPWMILFITSRYFGTCAGLFRKIFLNKNYR